MTTTERYEWAIEHIDFATGQRVNLHPCLEADARRMVRACEANGQPCRLMRRRRPDWEPAQ